MKKLVSIIVLAVFILAHTAYAVPATPTDIRVTIDGKEIPAICIYNAMYIAADDLIYFGYNLKFDNNIRTLFLNKTGTPSDEIPVKEDIKSLDSTDIRLCINGRDCDTQKYAASGKLYISADFLTDNSIYYSDEFPFGLDKHWNADTRTLELFSVNLPSKEEQISAFVSPELDDGSVLFNWKKGDHFYGSFYDIVECYQSGTPHGTYKFYQYFCNNGVTASLNSIFNTYGFHDIWGRCLISNLEIVDDKLCFDGHKTDGRTGRYYLDPETLAVITISETEPDDSKRTVPDYELTPIGQELQNATFKTTLNGKEISSYVVNTESYIDADLLLNCGYMKFKPREGIISYVKTGSSSGYNEKAISGTVLEFSEPQIFVDGRSVTSLNVGGVNIIGTTQFSRFFNRDTSLFCEWDAENNSLNLSSNIPAEDYESAKKKMYDYIEDGKNVFLYEGEKYSVFDASTEILNDRVYLVRADGVVISLGDVWYSIHGIESFDFYAMDEDNSHLIINSADTSHALNLTTLTID